MCPSIVGLEGSCGLKKIHDAYPEVFISSGIMERGNFFGGDYKFVSGKDEVIREGTQGYIVSFGEALYRSLDAVERLKQEGIDV